MRMWMRTGGFVFVVSASQLPAMTHGFGVAVGAAVATPPTGRGVGFALSPSGPEGEPPQEIDPTSIAPTQTTAAAEIMTGTVFMA